jgi:hypothetical protein
MNAELAINLWAIYDSGTGFVYGLAGRAYNIIGSDAEKLAILKSLSATDYLTTKRYQVPKRFSVSYTDGTVKEGVAFLNAVYDPHAQLFEEIFANIELELPPIPDFSDLECKSIKQMLPIDPLCVITVLYEDDDGVIRAIITDEDRAWVAQHQRVIHGI